MWIIICTTRTTSKILQLYFVRRKICYFSFSSVPFFLGLLSGVFFFRFYSLSFLLGFWCDHHRQIDLYVWHLFMWPLPSYIHTVITLPLSLSHVAMCVFYLLLVTRTWYYCMFSLWWPLNVFLRLPLTIAALVCTYICTSTRRWFECGEMSRPWTILLPGTFVSPW